VLPPDECQVGTEVLLHYAAGSCLPGAAGADATCTREAHPTDCAIPPGPECDVDGKLVTYAAGSCVDEGAGPVCLEDPTTTACPALSTCDTGVCVCSAAGVWRETDLATPPDALALDAFSDGANGLTGLSLRDDLQTSLAGTAQAQSNTSSSGTPRARPGRSRVPTTATSTSTAA